MSQAALQIAPVGWDYTSIRYGDSVAIKYSADRNEDAVKQKEADGLQRGGLVRQQDQ